MSEVVVRRPSRSDATAIREVYRAAAAQGTLARMPDEVDDAYVAGFMAAAQDGLELVAEAEGTVVGDLHASRLSPRIFAHTLGELTIAVHPDHQGRGIGKRLFTEFMRIVREEMADIERVELFAWDENKGALKLYESVGFKCEGLLPRRVRMDSGEWRNDILYGWLR
jgi:ribosomal protein S18 acetylase RimI-like enzyme